MQYNDFISTIEHYYGHYDTPEKKTIMTEFIMDNVSESELEPLFKKIILNISSQFKTPPDVAQISGLFADKIEIQANEIWHEVNRKANAYADLIFADTCAFLAFRNATGGLVNFSQRTREEEVWIKKRFVELYKLYVKNPQRDEVKPIMRGLANGAGNGGRPVMIGDENKCKELINDFGNNRLIESLTANIKRIEEV